MDSLLRLKELLQAKGMTGKELAEAINVSANTITNFIQGNRFPRPEMLLVLAEALDVDIRELFHPTKEDKKSNRLFIEHKGKYYPIGSLDADLFDGVGKIDPQAITTESELIFTEDQTVVKTGKYISEYLNSGFEAFWDNFHFKAAIPKSTSEKKRAFEVWKSAKGHNNYSFHWDKIEEFKGEYYNIIGYIKLMEEFWKETH